MASRTPPFARFEWMIAWRYLRARRADGGVSVMTWISLLGISLAVFALIATLSVRAGFRAEFVDTILGSNAHVTVYNSVYLDENGRQTNVIPDFAQISRNLAAIDGVTRAAPLVRGQVMANLRDETTGVDVYGITADDILGIPRVANPQQHIGDLARFGEGIAIGSGVARTLGVTAGDTIKLISPNGIKTAFGTSPRVNAYEVVYVFTAGRYDIDQTRVYMPFAEAQSYFNREGVADEIEVMVEEPEQIDDFAAQLLNAGGEHALIWTWRDRSGGFLRALKIEDNVMFIIMSILVLIAAMNIISGLIMLVKNKGRDIGILRTVGLSEEQAAEQGPIEVYSTSFQPMQSAFAGKPDRVLMKLVVSQKTRKVLGCHIVAPAAGEMIQLAAIAVKMGATKEDFDRTVAVHPTMSEEIVTMRAPVRTA